MTKAEKARAKRLKNFRMQDERIAKEREDQALADKQVNQALIGSDMTAITQAKSIETIEKSVV